MRNLAVIAVLFAALPLAAQDPAPGQSPQPKPAPPVMEKPGMAPADDKADEKAKSAKPAPPKAKPAASNPASGKVVEDIIARVNNEIITRSEYEKSKATAEEEARQDCQAKCTPEQLKTAIENRQKNSLHELIDQSLLIQRGKDMGITVGPEVIKRLDQIRISNKLASMEELEKAVTSQGLNWEDFKSNIGNQVITQRVISSEVGSHITIGEDDIQKYYAEHKAEFVRPEQVALRAIEVNTEGKKPEEVPALKTKAETALKRVQDGEDFGEIAKRFSDGSTGKEGGYLGTYKRGELSKELEDRVFKMKRNDLTDIIETKQGYLILQVLEHYEEGEQPIEKVRGDISDHLYSQHMEPALREYLKTLREQSYVVIAPGYQEIAGGGNSEIQEVSATPEADAKSKKSHKKYLLFGKRSGETTKSAVP
jgi:peptidyl-prolyl cis-trans isomerase SurA